MASITGGEMNFFALGFYDQMAATAQGLYGYGYSAPFAEFLERPVACEKEDLLRVILLLNCGALNLLVTRKTCSG